MANPLPPKIETGTIGELYVQLRLLQFRVQAHPPVKDSGNDLIAFFGTSMRTIQVKTATGRISPSRKLPDHFDLLALVVLEQDSETVHLDRTRLYLLPHQIARETRRSASRLRDYELNYWDRSAGLDLLRHLFGQ